MRCAVVIAIALAIGCKDEQLAHLAAIKDEVCACASSSCAEDALKRVPQHEGAANHHAQAIANEMMQCLSKLHDREQAAAAGAASDPETPAPASAGTP